MYNDDPFLIMFLVSLILGTTLRSSHLIALGVNAEDQSILAMTVSIDKIGEHFLPDYNVTCLMNARKMVILIKRGLH